MKLFLVVIDFGYMGENSEPEWFHVVDFKADYEKFEKLAIKHLVEDCGVEEEEHIEIDNVWINEVDKVDGFKINVEGTTEIAITWQTEDVTGRAEELEIEMTPQQVSEVLDRLKNKHDANIGISWDTIDFWIREVVL